MNHNLDHRLIYALSLIAALAITGCSGGGSSNSSSTPVGNTSSSSLSSTATSSAASSSSSAIVGLQLPSNVSVVTANNAQ